MRRLYSLLFVAAVLSACSSQEAQTGTREQARLAPTSAVKVEAAKACMAFSSRISDIAPTGQVTLVSLSNAAPDAVSVQAGSPEVEKFCSESRRTFPAVVVQALVTTPEGTRVVAVEPGSTPSSARVLS